MLIVKTVELADTTLPRADAGAGEPVVFLHGALGDWRTWRPVLTQLGVFGEGVRAIAYTQRWFGAEPRDHGALPFGTEQQARDLIAVLDALKLEQAHVVAWSFSAHSALAAAVARPDRIASLCLYDLGFPTFVEDAAALAEIGEVSARVFGPVGAAAAEGDWVRAAALLIDGAAGEPGYYERQPETQRAIHRENAATVELLFSQTPPVALTADDLRGLKTPTSIAWGERSGRAYALVSATAATLIPGCGWAEIQDAGHLWPEQDSQGFAQMVAAHLGRLGVGA